jgi:hypothetical protein
MPSCTTAPHFVRGVHLDSGPLYEFVEVGEGLLAGPVVVGGGVTFVGDIRGVSFGEFLEACDEVVMILVWC